MYVDKNHPNSPYFDDSHLDIEVWKLDAAIDGEIVDTVYAPCKLSNLGQLLEELLMYNEGANIEIKLITLRNCPKNIQDEIIKRFKDARDQQDYEDIKYYRELY